MWYDYVPECYRIKTRYHVVDPETEAAQARLDAMRTGRSLSTKPKKGLLPATDKTKLEQSSILDYRSVKSGSSVAQSKRKQTGARSSRQSDGVTPLPPPMVNSINLRARPGLAHTIFLSNRKIFKVQFTFTSMRRKANFHFFA